MEDCIFCKIIAGKIPSSRVYENDKVYAFLDIMPIAKGHTLIVPKKHSENMLKDDDDDLKACIHAAKHVAKGIMQAVGAPGFNLGVNTNEAAGQAVFHTHFHVIPRFKDDGLKHWPGRKVEMEELKMIQEAIVRCL